MLKFFFDDLAGEPVGLVRVWVLSVVLKRVFGSL
jgi:hypothetical protein